MPVLPQVLELEQQRATLARNISIVFNTARTELARKNRELNALTRDGKLARRPEDDMDVLRSLPGRGRRRGLMSVPATLGPRIILPPADFQGGARIGLVGVVLA